MVVIDIEANSVTSYTGQATQPNRLVHVDLALTGRRKAMRMETECGGRTESIRECYPEETEAQILPSMALLPRWWTRCERFRLAPDSSIRT